MRSERKDLHQSSTLPSISDARFLPVAVRKAGDGVKANPWRRKVIQDDGPDPDQEARAWRQVQLEQRHLEAYRNLHRLRDALHSRYAALLRDKVHSQRLVLQQRHETAGAKSDNETKQSMSANLQEQMLKLVAKKCLIAKKQKRLAFSKLQHNDSYLKSLPKTSYYLIFDLQKQLAEHGHLRTHNDLEDFYRCIEYGRHPSQLHKSLEEVRKRMLERSPAADFMTSEQHPAEGRGHEDHVSQPRLLEQGSVSEQMIFTGSKEKDEDEPMFPKMKASTFATLQPNFMRNFQSKMPDLILPGIPKKSRKAEIYLRRLRQMHDLCLTNMAFSQRLLDRETDRLCWQEERGHRDLVPPGFDSKQGERTNQPPRCSPKQPGSVQNERPPCPRQPSRRTSPSHRCFETPVWDTAACCRKTPDPLSMEDVCQQKHVQIIDRGSELWKNYTEITDH